VGSISEGELPVSQARRQWQAGSETWKVVVAIVVGLVAFGGGWLIRDAALSRQAAEETQGRLGALENALDAFWRQHDAELGRAQESVARVQQEATRLKEETARVHAEIARLRDETGGVRDDLAYATTAAAELARQLEALSAGLEAARSDLNAVRAANSALLQELERSQQEAQALSEAKEPGPAAEVMVTYRVRSGDTLSEIAYSLMGSPLHYPVIADVNQLESADLIRPGQQLKIPVPAAEP